MTERDKALRYEIANLFAKYDVPESEGITILAQMLASVGLDHSAAEWNRLHCYLDYVRAHLESMNPEQTQ